MEYRGNERKNNREFDWIACIVRYRLDGWMVVLCRCEKAVSAASTNHKSKLELEKGGQGGGISLEREKRGDAR